MKKRKITKKKITDLVSYATILLHNNNYKDVISDEQIGRMLLHYQNMFDSDEQKAIGFIKAKVKTLVAELEEDLSVEAE